MLVSILVVEMCVWEDANATRISENLKSTFRFVIIHISVGGMTHTFKYRRIHINMYILRHTYIHKHVATHSLIAVQYD